MLLKNTIVATICGSTFISLPTFGQENNGKPDISIAASVHFVGTVGGQQSACAADSLPAGYRLFFDRCDSSGCSPNTPAFNQDRWAIGVKNKSDGGFVAHTFWFPEKSTFVLGNAPIFDLRTIAGADTQPRFDYLHKGADYFNPTQLNETPQTKHRGVFYNSATLNINGLRGFTDREQPAIVFGSIF
jgi:hypothetical protein